MGNLNCCIFCGSKNVNLFIFGTLDSKKKFFVVCQSCEAQGPRRINPEMAIAEWNGAKDEYWEYLGMSGL